MARYPSDLALTLLRDLIDARCHAESRLAEAGDNEAAAQQELQELERMSAKRSSCADPAPFLQRLEAFIDISADADRLRRESLARSFELSQLSEEAARLNPAAPALDQLARLALPDAASIEEARQTFLSLEEEEKHFDLEMKALRESLATVEEEIRTLSLTGSFATREDLHAARQTCESVYAMLDAALDSALAAAQSFRGTRSRQSQA